MRVFELSKQKNIRDLGGLVVESGKKVKNNRIFRGGFFDKVTAEDIKIIESFHLTDVIDFRSEKEFETRPDYRIDGVTYHNFPPMVDHVKEEDKNNSDGNLLWFVSSDMSGKEHMIRVYEEIVTTEVGIEAYKKFFDLLLSKEDGVFYFHCSQGKDRAGIAAYLLETALGVDEVTKRQDYLLSNIAMNERIPRLIENVKNKPYFNEQYLRNLYDVFSAKEEYLDAAIKAIEERYSSVLEFIKKGLGVDISKLQDLYLE